MLGWFKQGCATLVGSSSAITAVSDPVAPKAMHSAAAPFRMMLVCRIWEYLFSGYYYQSPALL
jgi:hypothetical protein